MSVDNLNTDAKNLHIRDIPSELYWKIIEIKTRFRVDSWPDFFRAIVGSEITPHGEYVSSASSEQTERILVNDLSPDIYWGLIEKRNELKCRNWISFLHLLPNADIVPRGGAGPDAEALP